MHCLILTMAEEALTPAATCPVCNAEDAYIEPLAHRDVIFVECVNCRVYLADRKAFRHFQYLRGKADPASLSRLGALGTFLKNSSRTSAVRLTFDTWTQLIGLQPS